MNEEEFLKEIERVEELPSEARKEFYARVLEEEQKKTPKRLLAYFYYALQFYREGDFKRTREILEPFVIDYQSYAYRPQIIACFNLMGVASHCEGEYQISRFFYQKGAMLAKEHGERSRLSYEYNNIALTYIAEQNYTEALVHILHAREHLHESDEEMGAYVYLNMALIYLYLDELEKSLESFERSVEKYHADEIIPDDVLVCGMRLFCRLGVKEKYSFYKEKILEKLENMYAPEFIDASKAIFDCGMQTGDLGLTEEILKEMDAYIRRYPHENKVGLNVEECRYLYAKEIGDQETMLKALLRKNQYYRQIIEAGESRHIDEFEQYFRINRQLQEAVESEARANQVKTQFLANMSHDVRTPINGIMGMLQIIKMCQDDPEKVEDCLEKIDASSRHLLSLVNDVLDMTKLENMSADQVKEPFNLDQVCREVDQVVTFQAVEEGIRVEQEHIDVSEVNLLGNALNLKKILTNLFSNCMKYNKPGGAIYTSLREVSRTEKWIVFEFKIRDTGVGMTKEFIENKLFEPFIQGENAARSKYDGTGLGMSIVNELIKQMDGTIQVESTPGIGTCFTVILPFEINRNVQPKENTEIKEADISGKRVLVVEDNELNMEIAKFVLEESGVVVEKAENGKSALDKYLTAEDGRYDLILMDLMMPVMDGYETARAIRASEKADASDVPIIAMSANAYEEDVQKCLEAGMNAHVGKPIFHDLLMKTIQRFIK